MKTTITEADVLRLTGAAHTDILNWMGRLPLNTKYAKTTAGRARPFSKDNTLEIMLMTRLIKKRHVTGRSGRARRQVVQRTKGQKTLRLGPFHQR